MLIYFVLYGVQLNVCPGIVAANVWLRDAEREGFGLRSHRLNGGYECSVTGFGHNFKYKLGGHLFHFI